MGRTHWRLAPAVETAARAFWIVAAAVSLYMVVGFLPEGMAQMSVVCQGAECREDFAQLPPEGAAMLAGWGITPQMYAVYAAALSLAASLVFWSVGLLLFVRTRDWIAYLVSLAMVLFGALSARGVPTDGAWLLIGSTMNYLLFVCLVLGFYLFPNGHFVPHWTRWVAYALFFTEFFYSYFPDAPFSPHNMLPPLETAIWVGALALIPISQIYRYWRVDTPVERQQTKWVVAGLAVVFVGIAALVMLGQLVPPARQPLLRISLNTVMTLCFLAIPITLAIAVLRYRLFEIDLVIRRTLGYSILTALLALIFFGSVVILQRLFSTLTGQGSQAAVVLSTLAIATLFTPLRARVQSFIDRRFYRRKYDAAAMLGSFAAHCRNETEQDLLTRELAQIVRDTMQPEQVQIWIPERGSKS